MGEKILQARAMLALFFKERREQMGATVEMVATHLGISPNTLKRIEENKFEWGIDLHLKLCQALGIKPYFSVTESPIHEDYKHKRIDDPERYHGFYICDNLLLFENQCAIVKLSHPRLFVRFNYGQSFTSYNDWVANHTELEWLDPNDKPSDADEIEYHLTECWNFLGMHERKEDELFEEGEDD
jgi:DNA-binding XRE family transcriptional regulator